MKENVKTIYGKVKLMRTTCPECGDISIVLDGKTLCCEVDVDVSKVDKIHKMTASRGRYSGLTDAEKEAILEKQSRNCFYCGHPLDNTWYTSPRMKFGAKTRIEFDHVIPHCFQDGSNKSNFVAACNICNKIKRGLVFETSEEIIRYVKARRSKLGYQVIL